MQLKAARSSSPAARRDWAPATARMVVAGGGNAVIADLKEAEGKALAAELGAQARFVRTDVTDEASAPGRRRGGARRLSAALHGLVNCAGIVHGEKVVGKEGPHTLAGFARTININLVGIVQHDAARRRGDGEERAERRRRARRDRLHGVGRGVRRPDRAGGLLRVEGAASSA